MDTLLIGSLQLGLLYAVMAMGVYITFRILNIPDLTVDGSFSLGMAITVILTVNGHPYLGVLAAILFGAMAGTVTGLLQTTIKIHPILSGILTMTGLYTINLYIMGEKSNISLLGKDTIFTIFQKKFGIDPNISKTILPIIICIILLMILIILFKTRIGLAIRATGDNENMVQSSSINADIFKCIGIAIGNACVALCGGLICQYQSSGDLNHGNGMVIIGLASVIIGEAIVGKRSVSIGFISAIIGSTIYRIIIAFALKFDLFPSYAVNLISSLIVVIALFIPKIKETVTYYKGRKKEEEV